MKRAILALALCACAAVGFAAEEPAAPVPQELNIIYLVPSDMQPLEGYQQRLGKILLEIRDFYNRELARLGSSARLRMPLDPATGLVALEEVKGKRPLAEYPYQTGWQTALPEIQEYLLTNPRPTRSDRTLILIPDNREKFGVPFYGWGNYCFALDYPGFDFADNGQLTEAGMKFLPWYGGMAHELGHGLGLPHTHATVSQERLGGTALMGAGNGTLGVAPTCLTPGDVAFLESSAPCRPFEPRPVVKANQMEIAIGRDGDSVRIIGQLPTACTVRRLVAAYDKDEFGGNNDNYDAESFVIPFATDGRFDFTFPMSEIHPGKTPKAQIQLRLIHDDSSQELLRYTLPEA